MQENDYDRALAKADEKMKSSQAKPGIEDELVRDMTEHEATAFHFLPEQYDELVQMRRPEHRPSRH